jgi:hypothetical protein
MARAVDYIDGFNGRDDLLIATREMLHGQTDMHRTFAAKRVEKLAEDTSILFGGMTVGEFMEYIDRYYGEDAHHPVTRKWVARTLATLLVKYPFVDRESLLEAVDALPTADQLASGRGLNLRQLTELKMLSSSEFDGPKRQPEFKDSFEIDKSHFSRKNGEVDQMPRILRRDERFEDPMRS